MGAPTPGPWRTDPECDDEAVLGPSGEIVADCCTWDGFGSSSERTETNKANARFVAAAPDMLAALEGLFASLAFDEHPDDFAPDWHAARAAIAKAKGEAAKCA